MVERTEQVAVLGRGLEQVTALLATVSDEQRRQPTPCPEWDVSDLTDHLVQAADRFGEMVRGAEVDWSQPTPHLDSGWTEAFTTAAAGLLQAWDDAGDGDVRAVPDWQSAEVAVHTWDLSTALGRATDELDPEVAERGLAFMTANLRPEMRSDSGAFGPEQPAPVGADPYQRIAAFAGRHVTSRG
jgi:uncharacterized protein (TIGR03086 family)